MSTQRLRAVVRGLVQGVGFRYSVWRVAGELGLRGFVTNQADGTVLVDAEGEADRLDQMEAFLREGPPLARVERVDAERLPPTRAFDSFITK